MKVLMCPPLHYAPAPGENPAAAMAEWRGLYRLLREDLHVQVDLLEPRPGLPKLVLAASGGFVWQDAFIVSRLRDAERRPESEAWSNFFLVRGYAMPALPEGCRFEGERDLVVVGDTLFAGYRSSEDPAAHEALADILGREIRSLRLSDGWDLPLDSCLCPLGEGRVLYHPEAFDAHARRILEQNVTQLQSMDPADVLRFGCNALVADGSVILPEGCEATVTRLEQGGVQVHTLPLACYSRHAAGPKALVLKIND